MDYKGLTKIGVVILATMGTCNKLPDKEEPKPEIIDTAINDTSADTAEEVKDHRTTARIKAHFNSTGSTFH